MKTKVIMEAKLYLFSKMDITLTVKAPNRFMAACYANEFMDQYRKSEECEDLFLLEFGLKFTSDDAIEIDNDLDFGVTAAVIDQKPLFYDSNNPPYPLKT